MAHDPAAARQLQYVAFPETHCDAYFKNVFWKREHVMAIGRKNWFLAGSLGAVTILCAALFTAVSNGQTQNRQMRAEFEHPMKASELIGQKVYTSDNQEKGKIKDLMLSPDGRVEYAAVSFGGFAGIGDKLFAVPLDAIHL